jgi:hypothetical protein
MFHQVYSPLVLIAIANFDRFPGATSIGQRSYPFNPQAHKAFLPILRIDRARTLPLAGLSRRRAAWAPKLKPDAP